MSTENPSECRHERRRHRNEVTGKNRAGLAVHKAKDRGELPHLMCGDIPCVDCGAPARDYDHRDYNKPLDVEPVCRRCNILRGPAIPADPPLPPPQPRPTECGMCGADISWKHYHSRYCSACAQKRNRGQRA